MPTVRVIATAALTEIGVLGDGEIMTASQGAIALQRFQNQIDSWAADRLTLSRQLRTSFTWPASTSTVQIGPAQTVNIVRPMFLDAVAYVVPGTSPEVEVPIGQMDVDAYNALSIKSLTSALPIQSFYQTNLSDAYGSLFLWPQPDSLTVVIYTPQAVGVPVSLDTVVIGPPGYAEAFMYQLALRLLTPFGVRAADVPLLVGPDGMAAKSLATMKRPNVDPGVLGIDAALVPKSGSGYNVLSDSTTAWGGR